MTAWNHDLGDLKVRSIALPRDGGVLNKARRFDYAATDLHKTFAAERRRLKAIAQQALPLEPRAEPQIAAAPQPPASETAPLFLRPRLRQAGRAQPDLVVGLGCLASLLCYLALAFTHSLPGASA